MIGLFLEGVIDQSISTNFTSLRPHLTCSSLLTKSPKDKLSQSHNLKERTKTDPISLMAQKKDHCSQHSIIFLLLLFIFSHPLCSHITRSLLLLLLVLLRHLLLFFILIIIIIIIFLFFFFFYFFFFFLFFHYRLCHDEEDNNF